MHRVLVVVKSSILGEAIERLLRRADDVLAMQIILSTEDILRAAIERFQPTVIIIEGRLPGFNLIEPDIISADLRNYRIITISSENNKADVVDMFRMPVTGLEDLLTHVKGTNRNIHADFH